MGLNYRFGLILSAFAIVALGCSDSGQKKPVDGDTLDGDGIEDLFSGDGESLDGTGGEDKKPGKDITYTDSVIPPDIGPDVCVPQCAGKQCGPDGCGGKCGDCSEGSFCNDQGKCESPPTNCTVLEDCYPLVCNPFEGKCVPCASSAQCAEADAVCDVEKGQCVECIADSDCPTGYTCSFNHCVKIVCPANKCPSGTVCDVEAGQCVECLSSSDCTPGYECIEKKCVEPPKCESSKDCPQGQICYKEKGYCVECIDNNDCPDGYKCNVLYLCDKTITCLSDKDCTPYDKVCDKGLGECVGCITDADCEPSSWCMGTVCVNDVCDQNAEKPWCHQGALVDCSDNGSQILLVSVCAEGTYCSNGECKTLVCPPGANGCVDNSAFVCSSDGGEYLYIKSCTDTSQACVNGACLDIVCEGGKSTCADPATLVNCSEDGTQFDVSSCPDGTWCDGTAGSCVAWVCQPNSEGCVENKAALCDAYGSKWTVIQDCTPSGMYCQAGACIPCDPQCGDKQCGPDACGGTCGTCQPPLNCQQGYCIDPACPPGCTGQTNEVALCGVEMCYPTKAAEPAVSAPLGDNLKVMWGVRSHYGSAGNGLAPKAGGSYLLLSSGNLDNQQHSDQLQPKQSSNDLFTSATAYDVSQFQVKLTAPAEANGFSVDFIFMSAEFGANQQMNDKFYMVLNAPETTEGKATVINYIPCANPADHTHLTVDGKAYCWFGVFEKPQENPQVTSLAGTGYTSSSSWMRTRWPVKGGETFTLLFLVQDTSDEVYDSAVIVDNFKWIVGPFAKGTEKATY